MADDKGRVAYLFNRGADARLRGLPLTWAAAQQYLGYELKWWRRGWMDVEENYGRNVRGRWACRALPPVREEGVA